MGLQEGTGAKDGGSGSGGCGGSTDRSLSRDNARYLDALAEYAAEEYNGPD